MAAKRGRWAAAALCLLAAAPARASDDLAARRAIVARMSSEEQQELLRKQERFSALPPEEQQRLRELQATIDARPDGKKLHEVLVRYHEWLKTLSPRQRADLADLGPEERVEKVKQIMKMQDAMRQQAERAKVLTRDDAKAVANWGREIVWRHRETLMKDMPDSLRGKMERSSDVSRRQDSLLFYAVNRYRGPAGRGPAIVTPKDIEELGELLSPEPRRMLDEAPDLDAKRTIAQGWVWSVVHRISSRGPRNASPPGMDEEVVRFFEHELPPLQRQGLLNRSDELTRDELRRLYMERGHSSGGEGRGQDRPRGPRPGGEPANQDGSPSKPAENRGS